jgi:hypothetical protein
VYNGGLRPGHVILFLDGYPIRVGQDIVGRLHREFPHPLEQAVHLVQGTLGRLDEGNSVLRVSDGLVEALHLSAQFLADRQAGRVICRPVDPKTRGKPLHRTGQLIRGAEQVPVGIQRFDILVDP